MQAGVGLLFTDVMPIFMIIALDSVIIMHFSTNCSTVICSPTVLFSFKKEASSETYGPRVYFPSYIFISINQKKTKMPRWVLFIFILFYVLVIFYTYLYQISPLQATVKGLTTPLSHWVQVFDCLCRCIDWRLACSSYWIDTLVLKLREILISTLLHHHFLFKGKPMHAQEVARRISGAVAGEIYAQSRHTKYPS